MSENNSTLLEKPRSLTARRMYVIEDMAMADDEKLEKQFGMRITIDLFVSYFEWGTALSPQEVANKVYDYVQDERDALVVEAKAAIIRLLDGERIEDA